MSGQSVCSVCAREDMEDVEATAQMALDGTISWREVGRRVDLNPVSIKNHMERHWSPAPTPVEAAMDPLGGILAETIRDLQAKMTQVPPEVAALYGVIIHNLSLLSTTKASQQNLITALKTVHEVTGMRLEQQLLLQFAEHAFGVKPAEARAALPEPSIEVVIEAAIVEEAEVCHGS